MCSLAKFPPIPATGTITLCEIEGKIQMSPIATALVENYTTTAIHHPRISVTRDIDHALKHETSRVFLPVDDTLIKQLVTTWLKEGPFEALKLLAESSNSGILRSWANFIINTVKTVAGITNKFYPLLRERGPHLISLVSQTNNWRLSPVRCFEWHPLTTKLAVACWDDSVRIYCSDSALVPVLKCPSQADVSCLAWRPYSASELAVGCHTGIFVWTVDPNSVVARPSMSSAKVLKRSGHAPITGLTWSPSGLLLSCSASDSAMYLWNVELEEAVPLRRLGGGGVCFASWSPDGARVFTATVGLVFRVWSTDTWTPDRWTTVSDRVQTACWSPCGTILLFATTDEPFIYSVPFSAAGCVFKSDDLKAATRVIDLTPINISANQDEVEKVGGLVTSIAWDRKGRHLAIMFRECPLIAVFRTDLEINFTITPCCFVNGLPGETPSAIKFQMNFEEGALLTIAWCSGRIQHFPFVYTDLDELNQSHTSTSMIKQTFPYYNEW